MVAFAVPLAGGPVAPHQLAVRRAHADARRRRQRHHRAHALHVGDDRRRVARLVAQLLRDPDGLAGGLVERHHARVAAAGRDDHLVAVHERRLADQPRDVLAAEVPQDVALPHDAAVLRRAAPPGRRFRSGRTARSPSTVGVLRGPGPRSLSPPGPITRVHSDLAVGPAQARHHAVAALEPLHEELRALHGHRSVAVAQAGRRPQGRRAGRRPLLQQARSRARCPMRSGPRHCGQSVETGGAWPASVAAAEDDGHARRSTACGTEHESDPAAAQHQAELAGTG